MSDDDDDWVDDYVEYEMVTGGPGGGGCLPVVIACVLLPLAAVSAAALA